MCLYIYCNDPTAKLHIQNKSGMLHMPLEVIYLRGRCFKLSKFNPGNIPGNVIPGYF